MSLGTLVRKYSGIFFVAWTGCWPESRQAERRYTQVEMAHWTGRMGSTKRHWVRCWRISKSISSVLWYTVIVVPWFYYLDRDQLLPIATTVN